MAFWLFFSLPTFAQSKPDLLAVDSAFINQQYEKTELLALRILQGKYNLTPDEKARLYLTMGYAAIMLGHEDDAHSDFARALDAVPNLELDPVQVSPKFRVVFDEVKAGRKNENAREEAKLSRVHSMRTARLTNLILPGSGQWLEGRPWRGVLVFSLQAATAAAFVWQTNRTSKARQDYLAQTDPAQMPHDYDLYNRNYQRTWVAGISMGLIYLASQADLIWLKPDAKVLKVAATPTPNGLQVAIQW